MNAVISGQRRAAILLDGERMFAIRDEQTPQLIPIGLADVNSICGDASDLELLEDIDLEQASRHLFVARDSENALNLALLVLDAELSPQVRKHAAEVLEKLLMDAAVARRLRDVLYARPLPESADLKGAQKICESTSASTLSVELYRLHGLQPHIREVWLAWEAIPAEVLSGSENRRLARAIAIRKGLFYDVVMTAAAGKATDKLFEGVSNVFEGLPEHEAMIRRWLSELSRPSVDEGGRMHKKPRKETPPSLASERSLGEILQGTSGLGGQPTESPKMPILPKLLLFILLLFVLPVLGVILASALATKLGVLNHFEALLFVFALSLCTCLPLTRLARDLGARLRLVDYPDGRRKLHKLAIPVTGGIAVFAAMTTTVLTALFSQGPLREELQTHIPMVFGLLLAGLVIVSVGVADDFYGLRGRHKLAGQLIAVAIVLGTGLVVRRLTIFDLEVDLGVLAIPFTVFWMLGAINSLNLIDGMDGLSTSVGLIISLSITCMAVLAGDWATAAVAVTLAGALLGFLQYNFPPASIFLGESGSMFIGLLIGVLAIRSSLMAPATVALSAPVAALAIPILDTVAAILRRKLTGRSIYTTDRGHLHHCLLRRGLSMRGVLLWVSLLSLVTGAGALASLALQNELLAVLTASTVIGILIVTRLFGYAEFMLLKDRLIATGSSLLHQTTRGMPHQTTVRLQGATDWEELWDHMVRIAKRMGLKSAELKVDGPPNQKGFHARWVCEQESEGESQRWRAVVPLTSRGQAVGRIEIVGEGEREHNRVWNTIINLGLSLEPMEGRLSEFSFVPESRKTAEPYVPSGFIDVNGTTVFSVATK